MHINTKRHFLSVVFLLLGLMEVSAQHGLSFDIGYRHEGDTIRTTYFNTGITSVTDSLRGVQVNGLLNMARRHNGVQVAGFSNISLTPVKGVQFSGLSNVAMGMKRGLQLSMMLNVASGDVKGAQIGGYNYADTLNGSQIGFLNIALRHPKGWQIGVINYSRDTIANKIGLININPRTTIDMLMFTGNDCYMNIAARFRNRSTYNILNVGMHSTGLDRKFSGALGYRIGKYFMLSRRWSLSADLGYNHVESFEHDDNTLRERFYELQARLNADYQLTPSLGAFATVGFTDMRRYSHAAHYRSRMLYEAGLSFRYPHSGQRRWRVEWDRRASDTSNEGLLVTPMKPSPWMALAEATAVNVFVQCFDRFVTAQDYAQTTWKTGMDNIKNGFVWDNDRFSCNLIMHPYHGNLYFNSARENGLSYWASMPYPVIGSLQWEIFGEKEPPAINDFIATSFGGMCIGEVLHRMSNTLLDDSKRGWPRFFREAAAFLVSPIKGVNRLVTGKAWHVSHDKYLYHDSERNPLDFSITAGSRYLVDDGKLFRGASNPFVNLFMEYGDALNESGYNKPYDFFDFEATFSMSKNQPIINHLNITGRLWGTQIHRNKGTEAVFGIYQHFDYFDSEAIKDGSTKTPYRISEAAAFGPGLVLRMPSIGVLSHLEQRFYIDAVLLGGTKSDYLTIKKRDYTMGSGYSVKNKTHMELRHFGRFIFNTRLYHLFTWKGYENKDLTNIDPLYVNAQGDKGNVYLVIVNPLVEIDITPKWSANINGNFFYRRTHYKYYNDVRTRTYDLRFGLTCHI